MKKVDWYYTHMGESSADHYPEGNNQLVAGLPWWWWNISKCPLLTPKERRECQEIIRRIGLWGAYELTEQTLLYAVTMPDQIGGYSKDVAKYTLKENIPKALKVARNAV